VIKEQCISCGRDDIPLFPIEGAFMPEGHRVCSNCKSKYEGGARDGAKLRSPTMVHLAHEADLLMTQTAGGQYHCMSCSRPVMYNGKGEVPMYCSSCLGTIFRDYLNMRA